MSDADKYRQSFLAEWKRIAGGWHRWVPVVRDFSATATELMLDLAHVQKGSRVLDVGAGDGDQSLAAARRIGPDGYVLATDMTAELLAFARQSAAREGLSQLHTRLMDAERLELTDATFDAVISRLALMYFPNVLQALEEMRRVLRPGGRVSVIVFSTADRNRFFSIPAEVIRRRGNLPKPPAGAPGPFRFGGEGALADLLARAGFGEIEIQRVQSEIRLRSAAECVQFRRESSGTLQQMITEAGMTPAGEEATWQEVEAALREFEGTEGFVSPVELLVAAAEPTGGEPGSS